MRGAKYKLPKGSKVSAYLTRARGKRPIETEINGIEGNSTFSVVSLVALYFFDYMVQIVYILGGLKWKKRQIQLNLLTGK